MANTIKVKRTATPSKEPTTSDLELGEIGINTFDGKMFIKRDNGTASIVQIGGGGGGSVALNDLTDVTITSATTNDIIKYNGSAWVNSSSLAASQVTGLATVATSGLYSDLTGKVSVIDDLTDVTITSATTNDLIKYNGSAWINSSSLAASQVTGLATVATSGLYSDLTGKVSVLDDLTDVTITSAAKGQFVVHNGSSFINSNTIECQTSSTKGLIVKGAASQSVSIFEVQDSSGNPLVSVSPAGNVTVNNVTINGTTTTVNSTTVTIDDPIFTLGGDTAPTSDDNKDRGIEFQWHNGTSAKIGFFGYDDSAGKFSFFQDATNTSEVFSGTRGDAVFNTIESSVSTGTAPLTVASTTVVTNLNADKLDGFDASQLRVPVGTITAFAASTIPTGWLLCNGDAVSRTTYADLNTLFAADSYKYGAGDGTTTFNLPNLQQRFPLGKATSGTGATLGDTGGAIDHTHTVPGHYHSMTGAGATLATGTTGSGHGHSTHTSAVVDISHDHGTVTVTGTVGGSDGTHTHTINSRTSSTASNAGSLMRASATGTLDATFTTLTGGSGHGHSFSLSCNPNLSATTNKSVTGTVGGSDGTHTHNLTGSIGKVTSGSNGDSDFTSGSNNPPFLVVNYIIKT